MMILTKLLDLLERGPFFRARVEDLIEAPDPVLFLSYIANKPQERLTIMDQLEMRSDVNETLSDMLSRLTNDKHDTLMQCLANTLNQHFTERRELGGTSAPFTGDDMRLLILKMRLTLQTADLERERTYGRAGSPGHAQDRRSEEGWPQTPRQRAMSPPLAPTRSEPADLDHLAGELEDERQRRNGYAETH